MPSVLFVCTANRIRSPISAALLLHLLKADVETDLSEWLVESAGTWVEEKLPIHHNAQLVMFEDYGLDLRGHVSRSVTNDLLSSYKLVLGMEQGHKEALRVEFPQIRSRVYMLSEMVDGTWDISDPVHSVAGIRETTRLIAQVLTDGMQRIRQLAA